MRRFPEPCQLTGDRSALFHDGRSGQVFWRRRSAAARRYHGRRESLVSGDWKIRSVAQVSIDGRGMRETRQT